MKKVATKHVFMTDKHIMEVYTVQSFYITTGTFGQVYQNLPKDHNLVKDADVSQEIFTFMTSVSCIPSPPPQLKLRTSSSLYITSPPPTIWNKRRNVSSLRRKTSENSKRTDARMYMLTPVLHNNDRFSGGGHGVWKFLRQVLWAYRRFKTLHRPHQQGIGLVFFTHTKQKQ